MFIDPTTLPSWAVLQTQKQDMKDVSMRALFAQDQTRFKKFSLELPGLLFDYSKNRVTEKTMDALFSLAREAKVEEWRDRMFSGDKINVTEGRPVLHISCRAEDTADIKVDGEPVMPFVRETLSRMKDFSDAVRSGAWKGYTGKSLRHIVNIGIGGSDLGPYMACEALKPYTQDNLDMHFVSNVDGTHLAETLKKIDPAQTLFIIASKTFTTQETMANAMAAKSWMIEQLGSADCIARHFCALSTNSGAVQDFGIAHENMFPFKEWVGGRYSMWSAIGLSVCIAIGFDQFEKMLEGARSVDQHFKTAPLEKNIPIIMALLGIWYRNFWDSPATAILPYNQYLHRFPAFMQQMDMESNGKDVDRAGKPITNYKTGPVVFGEPGTNGQHAFYQLIHQGRDLIPCDFIGAKHTHNDIGNQHTLLLNNMLAQAQALMQGRTLEESSGKQPRVFNGNRPSNILLFERIDPYSLGMLVALYEHKIFTQGVIWNINSFDQFGVELGKELAIKIEQGDVSALDASTQGLLNAIKS